MSVNTTDSKIGTPFIFDKNHTVYFKGNGVTKEDAARVAGYLKGYGYFGEHNQSDVQISSKDANGPVEIGFIIGPKGASDETETFLRSAAPGLPEGFGGRKVSLQLLSNELKKINDL